MQPKIIKTDEEHKAALRVVEALWNTAPGTPEADVFELWVKLIEDYENKTYPMELPDPISAIKFRMEQQGLTRQDLEKYIGSKSKVSEVLNGKRPLSADLDYSAID